MATISSPRGKRTVQLSLNADGTWRILSDLSPAEIKTELESAIPSVYARLDALVAGEVDDDDDKDDTQSPVVPSN